MREKLNDNPMAQVAVIGFLVIAAGFFLLSTMGGGGSEAEEGAEVGTTEPTTISVSGEPEAEATGVTPVPALPPQAAATAPPPPPAVVRAFNANQTVALLFVRNGGIDDKLVRESAERLESEPDVSFFTVPASRIARYASIAQGVAVDRVPALVVIRPKKLAGDIPQASVQHGFQSSASIVQAVVDARYKGRTLDYHP
jgi:hypothetical protein